MGIIWDIVKEIPISAVLKDKVLSLDAKLAALETENSILKSDLRKANMQIEQLQNENKRFTEQIAIAEKTEQPLIEIAVNILKAFSSHSGTLSDHDLFPQAHADTLQFEYHLQELLDSKF